MFPLSLRLPTRSELELVGVVVLVFFVSAFLREREKVASRDAIIAAKPRVEFRDRIVEKRVVVKGPVHVVTVQARDGSKTITVDRSAETISTDKARDLARTETPVCPAPDRPRTWGFGGSLDLRRRDRGSVGASKSFGDLTLGLSHAVGAGASIGDVSGSASVKVW